MKIYSELSPIFITPINVHGIAHLVKVIPAKCTKRGKPKHTPPKQF